MKILFSPSETKVLGGSYPPVSQESLFLPQLYAYRNSIMQAYQDFISTQNDQTLKKLFGITKEKDLLTNKSINIFQDPTIKAIQRYTGVAYDYLAYHALTSDEQQFLEHNMIIFSNLFGPVLAGDLIPYYKLKQGEKLADLAIEKHYNQHFKGPLDAYLDNQLIIDLRAGFYLKFYKTPYPYITLKFIKNGKVVSHWAKAYRGLVVQTLSKYQPQNEQDFSEIPFKNLSLVEIQKNNLKTEYIYEITA